MNLEKFSEYKTGRLLPLESTTRNDWAFIPDPLPPGWSMTDSLWRLVAEARQRVGDLNGSGTVNLSDILYLINYIYSAGPGPIGGLISADMNCDGYRNLSDILYLIKSVYSDGPDPCLCTP